jgi:hypothetical protein
MEYTAYYAYKNVKFVFRKQNFITLYKCVAPLFRSKLGKC